MWLGSAPKKSILVPLGVLLILAGLVGPLPLTPLPPATPSSGASLAINLFRLCLLVGIVCAIIGALRNRKLKARAAAE